MKNLEKPMMSEKDYLGTHLKGMNKVKKRWYTDAMKNLFTPNEPVEKV